MIFKGINNQIVELRITNYQFPDIIDGDWDSNWLFIYLNVRSQVGNWHTVDPSLTTWDVQILIDWLIDLSNNKSVKYNNLDFTEPNLSFELLNDTEAFEKKIRIKFNLESRPKSASNDNDYFVDCIMNNVQLLLVSDALKVELNKFPERKPVHDNTLHQNRWSWWQKIFK
jgi:hypothetical protein